MTELVQRKRLEIIADLEFADWLADEADAVGITHFTIVPTLGGKGAHGRWRNDGVGGQGKCLFITVTSGIRASALIDRIGPLLSDYRMVLDLADVEVVRGDRF
ncbi:MULTISPECIES: P-II family nitrogen regulator [unclassified Sphingomonas]|uniref:P-II family nitrogen regulator n=1 Tax=unclassified Sphingomonas TaxID=196159 RepID=UPI000BDB3EF8|nr:MAG: hypothetical protein B7Z43_08225 [Sphingomonas sp. 12-62-6]OYX39347.1 MAG: hypothetical protein B7Y98_05310 [Sphingomonas sp. 32-62-10]OYY64971.1 MAG: hypothetical protein B7Y49_07760 [Sphingomonas sp. 28-62-11]